MVVFYILQDAAPTDDAGMYILGTLLADRSHSSAYTTLEWFIYPQNTVTVATRLVGCLLQINTLLS